MRGGRGHPIGRFDFGQYGDHSFGVPLGKGRWVKETIKINRTFQSGLTNKKVLRNIAGRMMFTIPLIDLLIVLFFSLMLSPGILIEVLERGFDSVGVQIFILPIVAFFFLVFISVPLGIFSVYYSMKPNLKRNRIEITDKDLIITVATNQVVLASAYQFPKLFVNDIQKLDWNYWAERKRETNIFEKFMSHKYKRRYGDLFHKYSDREDLILLKLSQPVKVRHLNTLFTNRNTMKDGKHVYEILVNIEKEQHLAFKKLVMRR